MRFQSFSSTFYCDSDIFFFLDCVKAHRVDHFFSRKKFLISCTKIAKIAQNLPLNDLEPISVELRLECPSEPWSEKKVRILRIDLGNRL